MNKLQFEAAVDSLKATLEMPSKVLQVEQNGEILLHTIIESIEDYWVAVVLNEPCMHYENEVTEVDLNIWLDENDMIVITAYPIIGKETDTNAFVRLEYKMVRKKVQPTPKYSPCVEKAARMISGARNGNPDLLHSDLINELQQIDSFCQAVDTNLFATQAIAVAIVNFQKRNPEATLYGD